MRALARNYLAPVAQLGTDYVLIARHILLPQIGRHGKGLQKAISYLHRRINQSVPKQTVQVSDKR